MALSSSEGEAFSVVCVWKCGICSAVCKDDAITYGSDGLRVDLAACSGCGICVRACPAGILEEEAFALL